MGQAAVGSDGVCEYQSHGESPGNEDIVYEYRHFYEMRSMNLLMTRTTDRAMKEPWNPVRIRTMLIAVSVGDRLKKRENILQDKSAGKPGIIAKRVVA